MNVYFENYENGWIFDGEYITRDKKMIYTIIYDI